MIDHQARDLVTQSFVLFAVCLILALLCAAFTVRITTDLFLKMEWQASELGRVSWHMVDNQETAARRFSHELHDELGQSLTAVKANLFFFNDTATTEKNIKDCIQLVDEAIRNVRELSQLLRPIILDDFGLDASLRWLTERFTQRTGIETDYQSNFHGRLADETETHLFRIAQEALTNAARHSGASRVEIHLEVQNGDARLAIGDNGKGLREGTSVQERGLGMTGMRARARSAGGELDVRSLPDHGVSIEVKVPARTPTHEPEDSHPARR